MSARDLLTTLPAVYVQLGDALQDTGGASMGERVSGGGNARPLPLRAEAAELRHQVLHDLRWWVARCGWDANAAVGASVPAMCAVLVHSLFDMADDDAATLTDVLADLHAQARHVLNPANLRTVIPLGAGTCPNRAEVPTFADPGEVWACGGQLRVMVPADRRVAAWLQCQECRGRWSPAELPQALDLCLPLSDAAAVTGIPEGTLKSRIHRGALELATEQPRTVRLGDLLPA